MNTIKNDKDALYAVKEHLLKQKESCKDETGTCKYRGYLDSTIQKAYEEYDLSVDNEKYLDVSEVLSSYKYDAKCAVGALISDNAYSEDLEERSVFDDEDIINAVQFSNKEWDNFSDHSVTMLSILQTIHDRIEPENWDMLLDYKNWHFTNTNTFSKFTFEDEDLLESNFARFFDSYVFSVQND